MYERGVTPRLLDALSASPVVLLHGARQVGKSTLAQTVAAGPHPMEYITLDNPGLLASATTDPAGFVSGLRGSVVIDEVQRAPEIFLSIKTVVDRDRRPGRFLLTGSAQVLMLPRLSESLAGRMIVLHLYPLAQSEIEGAARGLVDRFFEEEPFPVSQLPTDREDVIRRLVAGGYPEALSLSLEMRDEWFASYLTTILQREVRDLAQRIERLAELPRVLATLAGRTATLLNVADLSRILGIPYTSLRSYIALFQATFLVNMLPAWHARVRRRLVKAPKVIVVDTGLAAHLLRADVSRIASDADLLGGLLETFIITEVLKQASWSAARPSAFHYRTGGGKEVDLVLEDRSGRVVGIEVKAAATVGMGDFNGLRGLQRDARRRFHRGILFHLGDAVVPFGEGFSAIPVPFLWAANERRR